MKALLILSLSLASLNAFAGGRKPSSNPATAKVMLEIMDAYKDDAYFHACLDSALERVARKSVKFQYLAALECAILTENGQ